MERFEIWECNKCEGFPCSLKINFTTTEFEENSIAKGVKTAHRFSDRRHSYCPCDERLSPEWELKVANGIIDGRIVSDFPPISAEVEV